MISARRTANRLLLATILGCTLTSRAWAQETNVLFERIKLPRGATTSDSAVQDKQGFMWFATGRGLMKYDGHDFTVFDFDRFTDGTNRDHVYLWHLRVDDKGTIWISSSTGLHLLDPLTEEMTTYRHEPNKPNSLSHNNVQQTIEDGKGIIWIGTQAGLDRLDPVAETFTHYRHDSEDSTSLTPGEVWSLYEDRAGTLWVGTGYEGNASIGGLSRFNPATNSFTQYAADPDNESSLIRAGTTALYEDSHNRFWIGTMGDGLHTMDRERGTFTRHLYDANNPGGLGRPHLSGIQAEVADFFRLRFVHEDRSGRLWIGAHTGGVNVYDSAAEHGTHYEADLTNPNGLTTNRIWAISESRDGMIWIGSFADPGLEPIHKAVPVTPFRPYVPDSTFTDRTIIRSIVETEDGTVWIGRLRSGLIRLNRETGETTRYLEGPIDTDSLRRYHVWAIKESRDGRLWMGGLGSGLSRMDPESETFNRFLDDPSDSLSLANKAIVAIEENRRGQLWIGTKLDGLAYFDPTGSHVAYYKHNPSDPRSLGGNTVQANALLESSDGSLWIGTDNGLDRFDPDTDSFDHVLGDPGGHGPMVGIVEDPGGRLWIGWQYGTLVHLDPGTGTVDEFNTAASGLPGGEIASMLADDLGNLWVRTDRAIARFDEEDRRFFSYPPNPGEAFAGPGYAAYKSHSGELIFGGPHIVHAFYPAEVLATENHVPPQVAITSFYLFDEKVEPGNGSPLERPLPLIEEIELNFDQNFFSFDIAALHYLNPERNRLLYMLDGYDREWREAGPDQHADYLRVPPGDYTFRVKAANPFGIWSEEEASIDVTVLPPWWLTGWAYLFYTGMVGAALWGLLALRVRRLQQRTALLGVLVEERTRDLEAEKDKTEQQAKKLVELSDEKDRFFFNISHEFRTPLTLILGPIEDAIAGVYGDVGPRLHQHLLTVRRNGRKLHRLISQLLDLSKLEFGRMPLRVAERDLGPFVRFIVLSFAPLAERRGITLTFKSDASELAGFVDADKLEHVITNLLSNAFKFTSEHGKIMVAVSRITDGARDQVEISVMDTGTGIPSEELPFIFDRFHQADSLRRKTGEGTGIGLSLAKELVELHHGEIRVESREGFGTTFFVRLPLGKDHFTDSELAADGRPGDVSDLVFPEPTWISEIGPADESESTDDVIARSGRPTVVIVEDNADVREFLREHLTESYDTIEAVDGADGLEKVHQVCPDLVLADVMMPRMDGYQLCKAIKTDDRFNHIPVVLLTARASEDAEIEGLEAGADDYIYKPFSAEALMARMENLIEIRNLLRKRFGSEVTIKSTGATVESADAQFLEQVRDAAEAHLGDSSFSVEWLADDVGVSARQLRRKLRELLNLSPGGYIRMLRLERAAQLLEQKAGNVSEVAYKVGFNDPKYFSRLFSQTFGVAPSSYPTGK